MGTKSIAQNALEQGKGIVRLAPNWVPRSFCIPGRRIKLHPDDYYALGGERGGIDERWFASTTPADNGPLTGKNEGLSFIVMKDGSRVEQVTLRDAVADLKDAIIGKRLWDTYKAWPMYSKFFGFQPHITKDEVRACLASFTKGDNRITAISQAFRLMPGTGWDVPPGVLHAPGSLCTYEPQKASDVFAMYQSVIDNRQVVPQELLWKDTPKDRAGNIDYLMSVIDWEKNVDPAFAQKHFMKPVPVEMESRGYSEQWICYRSDAFSAKELTVMPGQRVVIKDAAAYGLIMMQGHGTMGVWNIETPSMIRFGQLTSDEFFVSESAARDGVEIYNPSETDPIVMLKHFGAGNPDLKL